MMKYFLTYLSIVLAGNLFAQIEQIPLGITQGIGYLQDTDSAKYFIAADQGIIRYWKSSGMITVLSVPDYTNGYNAGLQIIGDSIFYVPTIYGGYPYPFTLSRSTDQAQSWQVIFDTISDKDIACIKVMDTSLIYLLGGAHPSLKTIDGGLTWTETQEVSYALATYRYNDTIEFHSAGSQVGFTLDNAETWQFADNGLNDLNCNVYGIYPKNLDSVYTVLRGDCNVFSYCFSQDYSTQNWSVIYAIGIITANNVFAVSKNEVYQVGSDGNGHHRIAKTTDLGTTWQIFDPGINGEIEAITPINDSVFLVCGESGAFYKWNKNQTQWGSLGLEEIEQQNIRVFPNPSSGIFHLAFNGQMDLTRVTDFTGRTVKYRFDEQSGNLEINEPAGIYFAQFRSDNGVTTERIVIE